MGMFDDDERTLFRPPPVRGGQAPAAAPGQPITSAAHVQQLMALEEESSILEIIAFAWRAAGRRKGRSFVICALGVGLTLSAAYFAPREYRADGEIVVVRGAMDQSEDGGWDPTKRDRKRKEWEATVKSQPNLEAIIKDINLVARYDETRSPLQRLKAKFSSLLGDRTLSDEQKLASLKRTMEAKITPEVDDARITLSCDWHDPEVARDIVERALVRGIDARYELEVKPTYEEIRFAEESRESARKELERLSPAAAPPRPVAIVTPAAADGAPEVKARSAEANAVRERLGAAQARFQALDDAHRQKLNQARTRLDEASKVYGDKHPTIVQLKSDLQEAQREPADLEDAKAQVITLRRQLAATEEESSKRAPVAAAAAAAATVTAQTAKAQGQLEASDFAATRQRYDELGTEIDKLRAKARSLEANFKRKYTITRHPDVPAGPKRPIGLMVLLGGLLATLATILASASVADRLSGVFFEPQHVRDRLRLPVLGELQEDDLPII